MKITINVNANEEFELREKLKKAYVNNERVHISIGDVEYNLSICKHSARLGSNQITTSFELMKA